MLKETYDILSKSAPREGHYGLLKAALEEHPYASVIHAFVARSAYLTQDSRFEELIRKAAIRVNNRARLHNYVFRELPQQKAGEKAGETLHKEPVALPTETGVTHEPKPGKDPFEELSRQFLSEALGAGAALELITSGLPEAPEAEPKEEPLEQEIQTVSKTEEKAEPAAPPVEEPEPAEPQPAATAGKRSLTGWMQLLNDPGATAPEAEAKTPEEEPKTPKRTGLEIVEHFIRNEDQIVPKRAEFFSPERAARGSLVDRDDIVSETLAQIYAAQGNVAKAISTYEKLSLLHPEKSAYFAALIQKVKTEKTK